MLELYWRAKSSVIYSGVANLYLTDTVEMRYYKETHQKAEEGMARTGNGIDKWEHHEQREFGSCGYMQSYIDFFDHFESQMSYHVNYTGFK